MIISNSKGIDFMRDIIICTICSALVVLLDTIVSNRILKEMFIYSGTTFEDMRRHFENNSIHFQPASGRYSKRKRMAYRERVITEYILKCSANPQSAMALFNLYKYSTLPIPIAVSFVLFERFLNNKAIILSVYAVLLLVVIGFWIALEVFKRKHPIDEITLEKLEEKRSRQERPNLLPAKIFFAAAVIIMVAAPLISHFAVSTADLTKKPQPSVQESIKIDCADINRSMTALGFEFDNENARYSFFENGRIVDYVIGKKGETVFEFYYYDNDKIANGLYNNIIKEIAPTAESGSKVFTIAVDGVSYYVACKECTVVYAYSKDGYNDINELLEVSRYNEYLNSAF